MYNRAITLGSSLERKSVFLFGPRQTGKSTLLRLLYPEAVYYDLLEADTFREISAAPELPLKRRIVVCSAQKPYREDDGTEIVPIEDFFRALWRGNIL